MLLRSVNEINALPAFGKWEETKKKMGKFSYVRVFSHIILNARMFFYVVVLLVPCFSTFSHRCRYSDTFTEPQAKRY